MKNPFSGGKFGGVLGGLALSLFVWTANAQADVFASTNLIIESVQSYENPPDATPVNVSPAIAEIARLAQSGVSEEVLLAYITNADFQTEPTVDEILYLNDLGVSDKVITAILDSAKVSRETRSAISQNSTNTATPELQTNGIPTNEPVAVSAPTEPVSMDYFYETLAPYGSWVRVENYGLCWRPTVILNNPGWQPYCDRGRWVYTDCGWYWQSDYSWGWAPFHYGRWHSSPVYGWVWVPGYTWGPSWVSWRYSSDYCGWAPLPPEAHYRQGFGFSYYNSPVSISFDFGLPERCYTFVPTRNFRDREVYRHRLAPSRARVIYGHTVVNNYYVQRQRNVVNFGLSPDRVARATGSPLRQVRIHDTGRIPSTHPEKFDKRSNSLYAFRPAVAPRSQLPGASSVGNSGSPLDGRNSGDKNHRSSPGQTGRVSPSPSNQTLPTAPQFGGAGIVHDRLTPKNPAKLTTLPGANSPAPKPQTPAKNPETKRETVVHPASAATRPWQPVVPPANTRNQNQNGNAGRQFIRPEENGRKMELPAAPVQPRSVQPRQTTPVLPSASQQTAPRIAAPVTSNVRPSRVAEIQPQAPALSPQVGTASRDAMPNAVIRGMSQTQTSHPRGFEMPRTAVAPAISSVPPAIRSQANSGYSIPRMNSAPSVSMPSRPVPASPRAASGAPGQMKRQDRK